MIIPKEQMNAEDERQRVEQMIHEHIKLAADGYKCDSSSVTHVLVRAAIEGQRVERVCQALEWNVSSNTASAQ